MTTIATETLALPVPARVIALKGAGKAKREAAYQQIASLAYVEQLSRADTIEAIRAALGKAPTEAELKAAQQEYTIGRVAARLPANEMPGKLNARNDADRLEAARLLVTSYAAPPVEGKKSRPLRKGQLGRRSTVQHKVIRAADEAWSLVKAELGIGQARTQAEKNKRARSTKANPVRGNATVMPRGELVAPAVPTHSELAAPAKPETAADVLNHVMTQGASLLQYVNKHAGVTDTRLATLVGRFQKDLIALARDLKLEMEARDAILAARGK